MRSLSNTSFPSTSNPTPFGLFTSHKLLPPPLLPFTRRTSFISHTRRLHCYLDLKISRLAATRNGYYSRRRTIQIQASDNDDYSAGISSQNDWDDEDTDTTIQYLFSSSDNDDNNDDTDHMSDTKEKEQMLINNGSEFLSSHIGVFERARRRRRIYYGVFNNLGVLAFSISLLTLMDIMSWRVTRLPLPTFYLLTPFLTSLTIVSLAGYIFIPILENLNMKAIISRTPGRHSRKRDTPTMGGTYFITLGLLITQYFVKFSSIEVSAVSLVTLAFSFIGFFDDLISIKSNTLGLSPWIRIFLEVAIGIGFSKWMWSANISSPYSMKTVVPLPGTMGLVILGKLYPVLSSFCFVSMGNGINLTDGLDGLAGGTATLAFVAMSIVCLPICPGIAIFGATMGGACGGFIMHNRHKASVFMGDTGSLGLGGALAGMAACTGMYLPLLICSGVYVVESLSVIMQVLYFKMSKKLWGSGKRLFRMAPIHHHLELLGVKEPFVVAYGYGVSCVFVLCAVYIGLISA